MVTDNSSEDFLSLSLTLKAIPQEENGQRIVYCVASDESLDAQNEIVMQKALADSMEYMLARGNFDIDHITMVGAKRGIPDYLTYEIGRPTDIRFRGDETLVKGIIYSGEGVAAEKANQFWSSLTELNPPARWFPSVGGVPLGASVEFQPDKKTSVRKITKCRWANIGFSRQPVNQSVPTVQTVPMDVFAKSWNGHEFCIKSLTAGYGTDSATLTGGAAMRNQSLDQQIQSYWDFREKASDYLLYHKQKNPGARDLFKYARSLGLSADESAEWIERFLRDVNSARQARAN